MNKFDGGLLLETKSTPRRRDARTNERTHERTARTHARQSTIAQRTNGRRTLRFFVVGVFEETRQV